MQYTFKSGAVITGTLEQILKAGKAFEETPNLENIEGLEEAWPAGFYYSSKKGELVELKNMNAMYIRNALLKRVEKYVSKIRTFKEVSNKEFIDSFFKLSEDKVVETLITELSSRD